MLRPGPAQAPHASWPRTTTTRVPSCATAKRTDARPAGSRTWPATRTTNRAPGAWWNTCSTGTLASEQATTTASGPWAGIPPAVPVTGPTDRTSPAMNRVLPSRSASSTGWSLTNIPSSKEPTHLCGADDHVPCTRFLRVGARFGQVPGDREVLLVGRPIVPGAPHRCVGSLDEGMFVSDHPVLD